jgi:hypothetical protein
MGQYTSTAWSAGLVCVLACSSGSGAGEQKTGPSDSGAPTVDAASGEAGGADAAQEAGSCSKGCPNAAPAGSICAISADAHLLDTQGAPAVGDVMLLCGLNLCSQPIKSDAQGKVHFDLCVNMKSPALKFLGNASHVSFSAAMTSPMETFPPATLVPLPAQGMAFPSGAGTVSSGSVTLQVAAGSVTFDATQPTDANSTEFRAAAMTLAQAPPGLDPSLGVVALWGLAPANAQLSPPGVLTVPNPDPAAWPAGTQVDFVLNGLNEAPMPAAPYGGWGVVSTGTVSTDGMTITTDSDAGLPTIGLVGIKPHTASLED